MGFGRKLWRALRSTACVPMATDADDLHDHDTDIDADDLRAPDTYIDMDDLRADDLHTDEPPTDYLPVDCPPTGCPPVKHLSLLELPAIANEVTDLRASAKRSHEEPHQCTKTAIEASSPLLAMSERRDGSIDGASKLDCRSQTTAAMATNGVEKSCYVPEHMKNRFIFSDHDVVLGSAERAVKDFSARLASPQLATDANIPSPFLQLPTELRLNIYDMLFEPVAQQEPEHLQSYVLPSEWPKKLGTYTSLLLTCKQLETEASEYFDTQYLPNMTLYFDNVPDLRLFAEKVTTLGPKHQNVQICLHNSSTSGWCVTEELTGYGPRLSYKRYAGGHPVTKAINGGAGDVVKFICYQAEVVQGQKQAFGIGISSRYSYEGRCRYPWELTSTFGKLSASRRLGRRIDVLRPSMHWSNLEVSLHQARRSPDTTYMMLRGPVGELRWRLMDTCTHPNHRGSERYSDLQYLKAYRKKILEERAVKAKKMQDERDAKAKKLQEERDARAKKLQEKRAAETKTRERIQEWLSEGPGSAKSCARNDSTIIW